MSKATLPKGLIPRFTPEGLENIITTIEQNTAILLNSRADLARQVGGAGNLIPGYKKNIQVEAGYATNPDVLEFQRWFKREGWAARVVELWPEEAFQIQPEIYENEDADVKTAFEDAWEKMCKRLQLWAELKRLDIVSGIGRFGIMVLGFDDGKDLSDPIEMSYDVVLGRFKPSGRERSLLWVNPYSEDLVSIGDLEKDPSNPRHGLPTYYMVKMDALNAGGPGQPLATADVKVHWTRAYHYAPGRLTSKLFSLPRMERAFNRLYDILKICAGSGEGYWQSSNPTLVVSSDKPLPGGFDKAELRQQIWRLQNSLQKYLSVAGMDAKMLSPDLNDPTPHLEVQLTLLCVSLGVPKRVFLGTEEGRLAGEQDSSAWAGRVQHYRNTETGPALILPFVYHLMACGAAPFVEELFVDWPQGHKATPKEKAEAAKLWTDTLVAYADSPNASTVMPESDYLARVWDLSTEEIEEMLIAAEEAAAEGEEEAAAELEAQQALLKAAGMAAQPSQRPPAAE